MKILIKEKNKRIFFKKEMKFETFGFFLALAKTFLAASGPFEDHI